MKMKKYVILQIFLDIVGILIFFTLPNYLPYFIALLAGNSVLIFGTYLKLGKIHHKELFFSMVSLIFFLVLNYFHFL